MKASTNNSCCNVCNYAIKRLNCFPYCQNSFKGCSFIKKLETLLLKYDFRQCFGTSDVKIPSERFRSLPCNIFVLIVMTKP